MNGAMATDGGSFVRVGPLTFTYPRFVDIRITDVFSRGPAEAAVVSNGRVHVTVWGWRQVVRYYRNRVLAWPVDRLIGWLHRIRPATNPNSAAIVGCIVDMRDEVVA